MTKEDPPLRVFLLGKFTLQDQEGERPIPRSAHARSLLAYLFLYPNKSFHRSSLAALLAPEASEESARKVLNQSLWYIRRSLPGLLSSDSDQVSLSLEYPLQIDTVELEKLVQQDLAGELRPQVSLPRLKWMVDLYRGDLLEGYYEDWVLAERERLRELFLQSLEHLCQALKLVEDYEGALAVALRLIRADPLRESAHREVMRLHHLLGHAELSLKQFQTCQQLLQSELGLDPEPETVELAREISRRAVFPHAPFLPDANALLGESPLERNAPGQIPLIGRSLDKQSILSLVEPDLNRCGTIVVIEGEPGIGKTRLLQEIQRDLEWHGVQVVAAKASELETEPLGGILIRALKSGLLPLRVEQIRSLAAPDELTAVDWILTYLKPENAHDPLQDNAPMHDQRQMIRHSLGVLISLWVKVIPLVVILDDFHWSGEDAWEMLIALAEDLLVRQSLGVSFLAALRPAEAQARAFIQSSLNQLSAVRLLNRIELHSLDPEATGQLIRCSLGVQQPLDLLEMRLYLESGGNPLFTLESLRLLYEQSLLVRGKTGYWEIMPEATGGEPAPQAISPSIKSILTRRMGQLPPSAYQVLKVLAVIGDSVDLPLLRLVFTQDPASLFVDLHHLVRAHFLAETAQAYRFTHDTLRQAAYASLTGDECIRYHAKIARILETISPEDAGVLAYHFHRGQLWEQAAACYQKAGQAAFNRHNYHLADHAFSEAISLVQLAGLSPQRRFELLVLREKVLDHLGERDRQQLDLEAIDHLIDGHDLGINPRLEWLILKLSYLIVISHYIECESLARQGLVLAEKIQDQNITAHMNCLIGYALHGMGDDKQAIAILTSVIPSFHAVSNLSKESEIWRTLAIIHADACRYDLAQEAIQSAIALDRQLGDRIVLARNLWLVAWIALEQGDLDQAEINCHEALEISTSVGDRYSEIAAESVQVDLMVAQGKIGQAFDLFGRTIATCRYLKEEKLQISLLIDNALQVIRYLGDLDQAASFIESAEGLARRNEMPGELATCLGARAYITFRRKQPTAACRLFDKVLPVLREKERPQEEIRLHLWRIELELSANRPQTALEFLLVAEALSQKIHNGLDEFEGLASRTAVLLALGWNGEALQASSEAMFRLKEGQNGAYLIPYRYYQALTACGEPAKAFDALLQAVQMLNSVLDTLSPAQQKISRDQVPLHREMLAAWESLNPRRLLISLPGSDGAREIQTNWTVWLPEDEVISEKVQRRRSQLQRLLSEASQQGACPTHHDLAQVLKISERTLAKDLAALRGKV